MSAELAKETKSTKEGTSAKNSQAIEPIKDGKDPKNTDSKDLKNVEAKVKVTQSPYTILVDAKTGERRMVAARDLKSGETIIEEEPLIWALDSQTDQFGRSRVFVLAVTAVAMKHVALVLSPAYNRPEDKLQSAIRSDKTLLVFLNAVILKRPEVPWIALVRVLAKYNINYVVKYVESSTGGVVPLELGSGFYAILGFVNHSCQPNARFADPRGKLRTLQATADIAQGSEICFSYAELPAAATTAERRATLRSLFDFDCQCSKCGAP